MLNQVESLVLESPGPVPTAFQAFETIIDDGASDLVIR